MLYCLLILSVSQSFADERIIARINGRSITSTELDIEVSKLVPGTYFHKEMSEEKKKSLTRKAFEQILKRELISKEAQKRGISPDESEIDRRVDNVVKGFPSKRDFEKALQRSGLTAESYREMLRKEITEEIFIKREIDEKAVFTEVELKEFYNKNIERFREPEKAGVLHIMIGVGPSLPEEEWDKAKKQAEDLVKRARAGEDFSALASKYSTDLFSIKGGDLGFVHRGRLEPELEEAVFSLKEGEIGGPIRTIHGYSIVKVTEKKTGVLLSFENAKEKIKPQLEDLKKKELLEGLMNSLRDSSELEIFDKGLK